MLGCASLLMSTAGMQDVCMHLVLHVLMPLLTYAAQCDLPILPQASSAMLNRLVDVQVILMSATLDSHLFANYFGGAPALAAGGRTFPVEHFFLEDAHDLIGYHLDAESNCAVRPNRDARSRKQLEAGAGSRDRQSLLRVPCHLLPSLCSSVTSILCTLPSCPSSCQESTCKPAASFKP